MKTALEPAAYAVAAGSADPALVERVRSSLRILRDSGLDYELRCTVVPRLHTAETLIRPGRRAPWSQAPRLPGVPARALSWIRTWREARRFTPTSSIGSAPSPRGSWSAARSVPRPPRAGRRTPKHKGGQFAGGVIE